MPFFIFEKNMSEQKQWWGGWCLTFFTIVMLAIWLLYTRPMLQQREKLKNMPPPTAEQIEELWFDFLLEPNKDSDNE